MTDTQTQALMDITLWNRRRRIATSPMTQHLKPSDAMEVQEGIRRLETIADWTDDQIDRWVDHIFEGGIIYDWDHVQKPLSTTD